MKILYSRFCYLFTYMKFVNVPVSLWDSHQMVSVAWSEEVRIGGVMKLVSEYDLMTDSWDKNLVTT